MLNKKKGIHSQILSIVMIYILVMLPVLKDVIYSASVPIDITKMMKNTAVISYQMPLTTNPGEIFYDTVTKLTHRVDCTIRSTGEGRGEAGNYGYIPQEIKNLGSISDSFSFVFSDTVSSIYFDTGIIGNYEDGIDYQVDTIFLIPGETASILYRSFVPANRIPGDSVVVYDSITPYYVDINNGNTGTILNYLAAYETTVAGTMLVLPDLIPPDTPVLLSVISPANAENTLLITWAANTDVDLDSYILYRSDTEFRNYIVIDTIPKSDTSYLDTDSLSNYATYYYRVGATDYSGNISDSSNIVSGVPIDQKAPASPDTPVISVDTSGRTLLVTWIFNSEPDVDTYNVYRRDTIAGTFSFIGYSDADTTTFISNRLIDGNTYYYYITAVDSSNNESDSSGIGYGIPRDEMSPETPDFTLVNAPETGGVIELQWSQTSDDDILTYRLYRSTSDSFGAAALMYDSYDTQFTDTNLVTRTTYYYYIAAVDSSFNVGTYDDTIAVSYDLMAPDTPVGFIAATDYTGHKIDLSWSSQNRFTDVDGYTIYRSSGYDVSDTSFDSSFVMIINNISDTYYSDINLKNHTTYYYKLSASDYSGNESNLTDYVFAYAMDSTPPDSIGIMFISANTEGRRIDIYWTESNDTEFIGYNLYERRYDDTSYNKILNMTTDTYYYRTQLNNFDTYYYYVSAIDSSNNESINNEIVSSVPRDLKAPSVPDSISVIIPASNAALLVQWQVPTDTDAVWYRIYRSTESNNYSADPLDTVLASAGEMTDTGLEGSTTYYYRLTAIDTYYNESDYSVEVAQKTNIKIFGIVPISGRNLLIIFSDNIENDTDLFDTSNYNLEGAIRVIEAKPVGNILLLTTDIQTYGSTYVLTVSNIGETDVVYPFESADEVITKLPITPGIGGPSVDVELRNHDNNGDSIVGIVYKHSVLPADNLIYSLYNYERITDLGGTISRSISASRVNPTHQIFENQMEKIVRYNLNYVTEHGDNYFNPPNGGEKREFYKPAKISIPYRDEELIANNINENWLRIFRMDENSGGWKYVDDVPGGNKVYPDSNVVEAYVNHFSLYTIMGKVPEITDYDDIVVYPNPYIPSKPGHAISKMLFVNVPNTISKIEIYNIAGEKVKTLRKDAEIMYTKNSHWAQWDGKNEGGMDVSSGIYIFFAVSQDGSKSATGKFAIVR